MNLYKDNDMDKTLADLGIDKKQYVYLEQDTDESTLHSLLFRFFFVDFKYCTQCIVAFSGLKDFEEGEAFISIRLWNRELRRPSSVRDFVVPKNITLKQLKEMLA